MTRKERILVVDDEEGIRVLLLTFFSKNGYETMAAPNAVEAFTLVAEMKPHIMVTDFSLAGGGGLGLIEKVSRESPEVRCLFMTAYDSPELFQKARAAGASDCLSKPFDLLDLLDKVERLGAGARPEKAEDGDG